MTHSFHNFTKQIGEAIHSTTKTVGKHEKEIETTAMVAAASGLAISAAHQIFEDADDDTTGDYIGTTGKAVDMAVKTFAAELHSLQGKPAKSGAENKAKGKPKAKIVKAPSKNKKSAKPKVNYACFGQEGC